MHSSTQRVWLHHSNRSTFGLTPFILFSQCLERILYVWAIRHPACGNVGGINDLATPFFEVFLSAYLGKVASSRPQGRSDLMIRRKPQMPIPKKSIPPSSLPLSSPQSRPIRSGVSRVCSTASKITTSPRSRASSAASSAWRSSSRASMHRSPSTSPRKASSLCNLRLDG